MKTLVNYKIEYRIVNAWHSLQQFIVKLCNTAYYISIKKKVIFVNSYYDQFLGKVKHKNFGDDLNFYLISALSGKKPVNINNIFPVNVKNYACIGSIVEWICNENTIIWGSGAITGGKRKMVSPYKVLAVRGPLTRDYILSKGIDCPKVFGDPALLTPLIYSPNISSQYRIGIIPHYCDLSHDCIRGIDSEIAERYKVKVIDIKNYKRWTDIIDEILSCDIIASSSLHGIILSDAYGKPNVWLKLSNDITGGTFKYHDYFYGVNRFVLF